MLNCRLQECKVEILLPKRPQRDDTIEDLARTLLLRHTPEEVLDTLRRDHNVQCDIHGLIHMAGTEVYLESLTNEAETFLRNKISIDQVASLWNEAKRPAPGKPFWDTPAVRTLLEVRGRSN